jgi:hypothetical protein
MGIFDKFMRKDKKTDSLSPVYIEFTEEEVDAMQRIAQRYSSIAKAISGGVDGSLCMPKEDIEKIHAQGLYEYVDDLLDDLENLQATADTSAQSMDKIWDKAIKAILKAYTMHNMPIYLFRAAMLMEACGRISEAQDCFALFLKKQKTFVPDSLEMTLIRQMRFDADEAIHIAMRKLR